MVKRKANELDELKRFFESKFGEIESRIERISSAATDRGTVTDEPNFIDGDASTDHTSSIMPYRHYVQEQLSLPDRFGGDREDYTVDNFKFATEIFLSQRSAALQFPREVDKITFIGNLLTGNPGKWWASFGRLTGVGAPSHRVSVDAFWAQLDHYFGSRKLPLEDEIELLGLTQSRLSIGEFNTKFRQLAACIDWDREKILAAIYLKNLNPVYIAHLKSSPPMPTDVESLMNSCALFDPSFLNVVGPGRLVNNPGRSSEKEAVGFKEAAPRVVTSGRYEAPTRRCYECHEPGHVRSFCPLLADKRSKGPQASGSEDLGPGKVPATRS